METLISQTTPDLLWLFSAHFADGTVIVQDASDTVSTPDGQALKPDGSAFTDVRAALTRSPLSFFELHHTESDQCVTVDLVRGTFMINGTAFEAHDRNFDPEQHALELVYVRDVMIERLCSADALTTLSVRHYVHRYHLGWKCDVDGVEKKVTIAVG